ncbi:hypothetical protein VMCG_00862 [Cytospora schulzeri]|uniref:Uncharacterized protein n=1 Tax=Cytospora schulzeri TaxID=448051 RepID=A0A423X5P6_9PEZI|nr:hypothetical protein VMCG_00862 [Valsa malicola]
MASDTWQMKNIYHEKGTELVSLKSADEGGVSGSKAIQVPLGALKSLKDALGARYDTFYTSLPRVEYNKCERGYIPGSEGAIWDGRFALKSMANEVWDEL